ncbi:MAG: amidohydrolase family protein [Gemmatimonadota bacterium]
MSDGEDLAAVGSLALKHASVVSLTGDSVLRDWTLVLADGEIVALGPTGSVPIPRGAQVRDLDGRYVVPGLIDAHVHLREPALSLALFPSYGVTTVVNLQGEASHLALRDSILAHGIFAPRILSSGPFIDRVVKSPAEARQEVRRQHGAGFDLIKIHGVMEERTFAATIEEARRLGLPVIGHHPRNLETGTVLEGLDALAHAEELLRSSLLDQPRGLASDSVDVLARTVVESNTRLITTLGFFTGMRDQATDHFYQMISQPELAYVSPERRREWLYDGHREYIPRSELPWYDTAVVILHRVTGAIHKRGGVIIAGTDTPLEFTIPGISLHRELQHLVAAGLTPLEALRAATVSSADLLGAPALGRIEVGASADLLILSQDPTHSLAALDELEAVILRGMWIPRTELERRLNHVAAAYAREDVAWAAGQRIQDAVMDLLHSEGIPAAFSEIQRISEIPGVPPMTERDLNTIGYRLLANSAINRAIEVFQLNARLHPGSANVYDSLGEALLTADRLDEAETNYRRALELDSTMDSARRGLRTIAERRCDAEVCR